MMLETKRLLLRPWRDDDAGDLFYLASDAENATEAGWLPHKSIEDSRNMIAHLGKDAFAVVLKTEGKLVGSLSLHRPNAHPYYIRAGEMELGFWLGKNHRREGLMTEAVLSLMAYAFEDKHCPALWYSCFESNGAARAFAKKLGFTSHHIERNVENPATGQRSDLFFFRMKSEAWFESYGKGEDAR